MYFFQLSKGNKAFCITFVFLNEKAIGPVSAGFTMKAKYFLGR